jgi:hypothetical protein
VIEGDYFRGLRLTSVGPTQVTLTGEGQEVVLPLEIAKSDTIHAPQLSQTPKAPKTPKPAKDTVKKP